MKSHIPCDECDDWMVAYDKASTVELGSDPVDADGENFAVWTTKDCDASTFHICPECNVLAVTCNNCDNKQCQLIGHDGITTDGISMERQEGGDYGKTTEKPITEDEPRWNIDDLEKTMFKMSEWTVQAHFWYCSKCDTTRRVCAPEGDEMESESSVNSEDE